MRLHETSLYDPELDLAVIAPNGDVAAYALFWNDFVTAVGMVEPMRTEDAYQRLGLAARAARRRMRSPGTPGVRNASKSASAPSPRAAST